MIPPVAATQGLSVAPPEVTSPARTVTPPKPADTGGGTFTGDRPPDGADALVRSHSQMRAREALVERMTRLPQALHVAPSVVVTAESIRTPYADIVNMLRQPPYSATDRVT